MNPQLLQVLEALAAQQGRDPNELLAEMLRGHAPQQPQRQLPPSQAVEVLPPQQPVQRRPQMQLPQRYAGVPNPQSEADIEALARYLEAESGPTGVFGDGGMSAGGVFGGAPVATAGHDPTADLRSAQMQLARLAPQLVQALAQRPPPQAYHPPPPPQQQPVRMMSQTTTVYYEGPPPPQMPQHAPAHRAPMPQQQPYPQQLPPWWGRQR